MAITDDAGVSSLFVGLPVAARVKILLHLCPFALIPRRLNALLAEWTQPEIDALVQDAENSRCHLIAESEPRFVPPSVVVADVRELSEAFTQLLVLVCSETDLGLYLSGNSISAPISELAELDPEAIIAGGSDGQIHASNFGGPSMDHLMSNEWQHHMSSNGGRELDTDIVGLSGLIARDFVGQNPQRVGNFFGNVPSLCRQVTSISFKIQKHDIYVAARQDRKLRDECPHLLYLASAAQKVASAYRRDSCAGLQDMCKALCAGLAVP